MSINTLLLLIFLPFNIAMAQPTLAPTVDIYGTDRISADTIAIKYKKEINQITSAFKQGNFELAESASTKLKEGIKAEGDFIYMKIGLTRTPNDPIPNFMIDVVEKKDKDRLSHFLPPPKSSIPEQSNLISQWQEYEKIGNTLVFKKPELARIKSCHAHHCIFGFEDSALRKYEKIFNKAEYYKNNLVDIVRHDKDPIKRETAIFALSHIKDYNELVKLILPSINDSNFGVRNNALRVLVYVAMQHPDAQIPIEKIVAALDFPDSTDRNKSLYVIVSLVDNPTNAAYVKKHAGKLLMANLKLKQPNNHNPAYEILKKISGKNYGERDYTAWEKWLLG